MVKWDRHSVTYTHLREWVHLREGMIAYKPMNP